MNVKHTFTESWLEEKTDHQGAMALTFPEQALPPQGSERSSEAMSWEG